MNRLPSALWALGAATLLGSACTTGAIGIRECREIETLRCHAEAECGVIEDVEACERYVRDQCLHGIAGPRVPTRPEQDACLNFISGAETCAQDDPEMPAKDCRELEKGSLELVNTAHSARSVCDVIGRPWDFEPCGFLNAGSEGGAGGGEDK